jgi:hypothetical protein
MKDVAVAMALATAAPHDCSGTKQTETCAVAGP